MTLRINENYRIVSDPHCWILQRRIESTKQERWKAIGYHGTLKAVLSHAQGEILKAEGECSLDDLQRCLHAATRHAEAIGARLDRKLRKLYEVRHEFLED